MMKGKGREPAKFEDLPMSRRTSLCTQADITRLIKAAIAAGVSKQNIAGVRLDRHGATLLFGEPQQSVEEVEPEPEPEQKTAADATWSDVDGA